MSDSDEDSIEFQRSFLRPKDRPSLLCPTSSDEDGGTKRAVKPKKALPPIDLRRVTEVRKRRPKQSVPSFSSSHDEHKRSYLRPRDCPSLCPTSTDEEGPQAARAKKRPVIDIRKVTEVRKRRPQRDISELLNDSADSDSENVLARNKELIEKKNERRRAKESRVESQEQMPPPKQSKTAKKRPAVRLPSARSKLLDVSLTSEQEREHIRRTKPVAEFMARCGVPASSINIPRFQPPQQKRNQKESVTKNKQRSVVAANSSPATPLENKILNQSDTDDDNGKTPKRYWRRTRPASKGISNLKDHINSVVSSPDVESQPGQPPMVGNRVVRRRTSIMSRGNNAGQSAGGSILSQQSRSSQDIYGEIFSQHQNQSNSQSQQSNENVLGNTPSKQKDTETTTDGDNANVNGNTENDGDKKSRTGDANEAVEATSPHVSPVVLQKRVLRPSSIRAGNDKNNSAARSMIQTPLVPSPRLDNQLVADHGEQESQSGISSLPALQPSLINEVGIATNTRTRRSSIVSQSSRTSRANNSTATFTNKHPPSKPSKNISTRQSQRLVNDDGLQKKTGNGKSDESLTEDGAIQEDDIDPTSAIHEKGMDRRSMRSNFQTRSSDKTSSLLATRQGQVSLTPVQEESQNNVPVIVAPLAESAAVTQEKEIGRRSSATMTRGSRRNNSIASLTSQSQLVPPEIRPTDQEESGHEVAPASDIPAPIDVIQENNAADHPPISPVRKVMKGRGKAYYNKQRNSAQELKKKLSTAAPEPNLSRPGIEEHQSQHRRNRVDSSPESVNSLPPSPQPGPAAVLQDKGGQKALSSATSSTSQVPKRGQPTLKLVKGKSGKKKQSRSWNQEHPIMQGRGKALYNKNLVSKRLVEEVLADFCPDAGLDANEVSSLQGNLNEFVRNLFDKLCDNSPRNLYYGVWSFQQLLAELKSEGLMDKNASEKDFIALLKETVGEEEAQLCEGFICPKPGKSDIMDIYN